MKRSRWFGRPAAGAGRLPPSRDRRRRRLGSALLIVVLLVVLLAIIGTAFISTTSTDRVTAYQNADNTQVDLFVDGVVSMVRGTLVGDLFTKQAAPTEILPSDDITCLPYTASYPNGDSSKSWLAARAPDDYQFSTPTPKTPFDKFNWPNISYMPHLGEQQSSVGSSRGLVNPLDNHTTWLFNQNVKVMSTDAGGVDYPAFKATYRGEVKPFVAADADGDGIADSAYFPLVFQPRNGITYLAAVRVVDNCAALNVNTAWSRDNDFDAGGTRVANSGYFRSAAGLRELLNGAQPDAEMAAVNQYRFGGSSTADATPRTDAGATRGDFKWSTQGEALSNGLGARLGNPAWNGGARFRPFTTLDDTALAYRFCLINPEVAPTPLEQVFLNAGGGGRDSVYGSASNYNADSMRVWKQFARRLDANGNPTEGHLDLVGRWFGENFDYNAGRYSARPLLVTSNPVSRAMQAARVYSPGDDFTRTKPRTLNPGMLAYRSAGEWAGGKSYDLHDVVKYKDRYYASLKAGNGAQPSGKAESTPEWDYQPWTSTPQKASLNTSTFRELWRAYWCVAGLDHNGYLRTTDDYPPTPNGATSVRAAPAPEFSWSARRAGPLRAATANDRAQDMVQIRTALAAVNTIGLRDARRDVVSRTITLYRPPAGHPSNSNGPPPTPTPYGAPGHRVNVFSHEWQPVVSEVLIDTKVPDRPFVAVELFNPYPEPIPLKNWHAVKASRAGAALDLVDLGELTKAGAAEVPAGGYLVLVNDPERAPPDVAVAMGANAGVTRATLGNLHEVIGNDLMLVRPRRGDGALMKSASEVDRYDEGTDDAPNLADLVPVDQMDLTAVDPAGMTPPAGGDPLFRFRYARDTKSPDQWRFYFPGRYDPTLTDPTTGLHYDGLKAAPADPGNLGGPDAATYQRTARLKLHLAGWPGPNKIGGGTGGANGPALYPYGMFARVGDVLRVPLVGSYTVRTPDGGGLVEMTSVVMDSAYCDTDNAKQTVPINLGRFVPDDHWKPSGGTWKQHYSTKIMDYFVVRTPEDDYLPNVPEALYGTYQPAGPGGEAVWVPRPRPDPVANTDPNKANVGEPLVGDQGLVNVNTAPWRVLASLPLVVNEDGSVNETGTIACAKDLTQREWGNNAIDRPLYKRVMEVSDVLMKHNVANPDAVAPDDWETRYGHMIRLSNLLTVRSDSFTVYTVIEGWRDCYTPQAKRVLQRRVAFIADRSGVTESNRELRITNIPIQ